MPQGRAVVLPMWLARSIASIAVCGRLRKCPLLGGTGLVGVDGGLVQQGLTCEAAVESLTRGDGEDAG